MLLLALPMALGISLSAPTALKFEPRSTSQGKVLLVYDCGDFAKQDCLPWETGFSAPGTYTLPDSSTFPYRGDAATLADSLSRGQYDEVWLLSGGGQVSAGIGVARVLRARGAFVRVPSASAVVASQGATTFNGGGFCASSCTIAFMGGALRVVDPGAQYILHSPSSFLNTIPQWIWPIMKQGGPPLLAKAILENACESVYSSARLFQNTLQTPRRLPGAPLLPETTTDASVRECASTDVYNAEQLKWDAQVISIEGQFALQDIGMRMERSAAWHALDYWRRRQASLGPQFDDALQMISAMYAAPITALIPLSSAELLALGYVTEFVQFGERDR